MNNTDSKILDTALLRAVKLLLDDQHGVSEEAHASLMEFIYRFDPESKALVYLTAASSYKGRCFVEEGFEV
jgi:hypothetical protein